MIKRPLFLLLLPYTLLFADSTSSTDTSEYRTISLQAATNDALFSTFKRDPVIIQMYQHVSKKLGKQYLNFIQKEYPDLLPHFAAFRQNDQLGNPITHKFGRLAPLSATNLRYIKIAGDIKKSFGDLSGKRVIEIGGGYGGQCKVLSDLFAFKEYVIVDLPEVLELARTYLKKLNVPHVTFRTLEELSQDTRYDLIISNYAFTECCRNIQEGYLQKALLKAECGYLICNSPPADSLPAPYTQSELLSILSPLKPHVLPETPQSADHNFLLVWKGANN